MASHDLILLGQGPSRDNCPFDAETWASVSVLRLKGFEDKPYSKVFCFDNPERKRDERQGLEIAKRRGIPIIGWGYIPDVTEPYPLREMQQKFDTYYLKNDMSFMIAYALHLGYKSLLLWGVDQGPGARYRITRHTTCFWLGMATGMGVKWELAPNSVLWIDKKNTSPYPIRTRPFYEWMPA